MATLITQLVPGVASAGADCNTASTANALSWSTRHDLRVSAADVRREMGGQWSGPGLATSLRDNDRAWARFRDDARRLGWRLGSYSPKLMAEWQDIIDALDAGAGVVLTISYAVINDRVPHLSGDPRFRGAHAVWVPRLRRRDGGIDCLVFDPLYDGRRPSIPKGPQWMSEWVLRRAAEQRLVSYWMGEGYSEERAREKARERASFALVSRSAVKVAPPAPPEEDIEALKAAVAVLERELADRDIQAAAAAEREERLEIALGGARTALLNVGIATEAAVTDIDEVLGITEDPGIDVEEGAAE